LARKKKEQDLLDGKIPDEENHLENNVENKEDGANSKDDSTGTNSNANTQDAESADPQEPNPQENGEKEESKEDTKEDKKEDGKEGDKKDGDKKDGDKKNGKESPTVTISPIRQGGPFMQNPLLKGNSHMCLNLHPIFADSDDGDSGPSDLLASKMKFEKPKTAAALQTAPNFTAFSSKLIKPTPCPKDIDVGQLGHELCVFAMQALGREKQNAAHFSYLMINPEDITGHMDQKHL
jgi:hypothetical protein